MWNIIKNKIAWILSALGIIGIALAGIDGATITENELISDISEMEQAECLKGQCRQIKRMQKDGFDYEVHEYKTSKGEVGYQMIIYGTDKIKSIGYGFESQTRTYEYPVVITEVITHTATST